MPKRLLFVYAAEGDHGVCQPLPTDRSRHLFSGMIPIRRWDAARGDYVYGVRTDAATEEYEMVRYRLVEPF